MKLCIKNARHLEAPVDLLIEDGKILTMTPAGHCPPPEGCEIFEAQGFTLMPSLTDAHTHLREPGYEYKEDIASGLEAAARGGFGAVMCMANTRPVNDTASVTTLMLERARHSHPHGPRLYPVAAASMGLKGEELAPLAELKAAGCVAVSNDGRPLESAELVRRIMEYAADLDLTLIDHCEDPHLARGWRMHEGVTSGLLGVKGQPAAARPYRPRATSCWPSTCSCPCTLPTFPLRSPWTSLPGARRAECGSRPKPAPTICCWTKPPLKGTIPLPR